MNCSGVIALNAWFKNAEEEKEFRNLDLQPGTRVHIATKLDFTEQYRNPGVSTLGEYLDNRDLDAIATLHGPHSITRISHPQGLTFSRILYNWRTLLQRKIDLTFSPATAGVLAAAVLGNRHNLSRATADRFREGGTFHVLVISGAHISFIGGLVLLLAQRLTARRWLQFGSATLLVWCYAMAVGGDASVVRAALMFSFLVGGGLLYRRTSALNSLGAAALVLFVWRPKDIFDPALQLTFLSVLAIISIGWPILRNLAEIGEWSPSRRSPYPPQQSFLKSFSESLYWSENEWQKELKKLTHTYRLFKSPMGTWLEQHHLQRVLRYSFSAVVASLSVQLVLLPFQILYFHRLSWSTLILTLIVGVLLAALATVAFVTLLMSHVSVALAAPLVQFADVINSVMVHSVDPFARLGIASTRLPEYTGWARWIYVLYYVPIAFIAFAISVWKPLASPTTIGTKLKLPLLLCMQLAFVWLLVAHPFSARTNARRLELNFLDVGQGDSALVTTPEGTTLLIDGGGRPVFDARGGNEESRSIGERVVCEYLWSKGLDSIDYVLATHADADHIDGLNDVVRNFRVRSVLVGRAPSNDPAYQKLANTTNARQTPVQVINAGDVLRLGDTEFQVLWPRPADADAPSRNNDSVVLRLRFGERVFLLTGDIEKEVEELLIKDGRLNADVVKVPHHGSKSSSTAAFTTAVNPRLAVISVGRTSMFGHPHREVVERWQATGAEVLTTGNSGMITVTTDGKALNVTKFVRD